MQVNEPWQANSSTANTPTAIKKFCSHGNSLFSRPHPLDFNILAIFNSKNVKRSKTRANIFISLLDHAYEAPFANMKMERQRWPETPFVMGRAGTQYVAMVTELLSSNCEAHLLESYCKESNIS